jgi:hypothetical protein
MLYLIYIFSFLYILRFNKVFKIKAYYIKVLNKTKEIGKIKLTLPFRKTH